ncbi:MAG: hypothetical protein RJQ09_01430 [Cyclobacteriaceae bacterium]
MRPLSIQKLIVIRIFFIIIAHVIIINAFGQNDEDKEPADYIEQPERLELTIDPDDEDYFIVSAEQDGLFIFKETNDRGKKGFFWEFTQVDTLLKEQWKKRYLIPYGIDFLGWDYSLGQVHLLFNKPGGRDYRDYTLYNFDVASGDTTQHTVSMEFNVRLSEFEVVGNAVIMGGYYNYRPVIVHYDIKERRARVLPGYYNKKAELLDIETDDKKRQFNVLLSELSLTKKNTIGLKTFNEEGEMLQNQVLEPDDDHSLIFGQSTKLDNGIQYISGTYADRKSSFSKGVYTAKIDDGQQQYLKFYSYPDLENFFSYMSARRQEKVKERIKRRRVKGKKVRLNYRLLVHDVIRLEDEYIMIGEAYYPKYAPSYYGPMHSEYSYNQFADGIEGYRYTHAVIIAFDASGNVNWDNSFEINDVLATSLQQYVHVAAQGNEIVLLYMFEDEIRSKLIKGSEVLEGKTFNPIELKFDDDVIADEYKNVGGLEKWYGNSFYAYGIQRIKKEGSRRNRKIFYINKIVYR